MHVLIAYEPEHFVLENWAPKHSASRVTVQLWHFLIGGNVGVLIVEKWRSIKPIRAAMAAQTTMQVVRAGFGAHVDVRAAGGSLLGIVHRGVHTQFLNSFRSWSRQCLANRQVRGCRALHRSGTGTL